MQDPRILVALDYAAAADALALVERLDPALCRLKVGKELFTAAGPQFVEQLQQRGFEVFLDLKFHDIPNTVAKACAAAASLGVWMVNVHAMGGRRMLEAAAESIARFETSPYLIAVTVLTSMEESDLADIGLHEPVEQVVGRLAGLTRDSGLDGIVCSAREVGKMRSTWREGVFVTPGVRPAGAEAGDQRRIVTPAQALINGSSYLVIGRPITQAADPLKALQTIQAEIAGV